MIQYIAISFLVGVCSSTFVAYVIPSLYKPIYVVFNKLFLKYSKYAIDLTGEWQATYKEPEVDGSIREAIENISLIQTGAYMQGKGRSNGPHPRRFKYSGEIVQDIINGEYQRRGEQRGSLAGMGSFQLKMSTDRKSMVGHCMWLDKDTEKIESSDYIWRKVE